MSAAGVKFDRSGFDALRARLPRETYQGLRQELGVQARTFAKDFTSKRLKGRPGLKRRSGALARSVKHFVVGNDLKTLGMQVTVGGTDVPYAEIHEFGGTVRPKRAKMLVIPLKAAVTRAGVARGSPRSFPNTWVGPTRSGKPVIWQRTGKNTIRPLFLLVPQVRIPARLGFGALWAEKHPEVVNRLNLRLGAIALQETLRRG